MSKWREDKETESASTDRRFDLLVSVRPPTATNHHAVRAATTTIHHHRSADRRQQKKIQHDHGSRDDDHEVNTSPNQGSHTSAHRMHTIMRFIPNIIFFATGNCVSSTATKVVASNSNINVNININSIDRRNTPSLPPTAAADTSRYQNRR